MRLIIAEKPSLARVIASGIDGVQQRYDGYIQIGMDTVVTYCFGHLYELAMPHFYDMKWQKWDLSHLPIVIANDDWQILPKEDAKAQINVISTLLKGATQVINAGDPDREGQMLVDEVLEVLSWRGPTLRLLIHDPTPSSVRKALKAMQPNENFANLYASAKCRARADWLVGMNLSRAVSKRIGLTAHIGRVQTPTLALVVRRDLAIEGHQAGTFYTLQASVATKQDAFVLTHDTKHDRITDKAEANRIADEIRASVVTLNVSDKTVTEHAPLPFRLATFQKEAESRYGWTAVQALEALQSAYEKQLVSYPRTACAHLPEAQAGQAVPIIKAILKAGHFGNAVAALDLMKPSGRVYDDKKVGEHHGLTPTSIVPNLDAGTPAFKAWQLVTEQFIKSLLPWYTATVKEVSFVHAERVFKASGETPSNEAQSWRLLEPKRDRNGDPLAPLATALKDGESAQGRVGEVIIKQGKTTPPERYTEATLIADMENVHKFVADQRIKAALKENAGIGTAATQGATIETLKRRKYLELAGRGVKKHLRSTRLGRYLIEHAPAVLSDPGITALWEEQLDAIAKGKVNPNEFLARIDGYVLNNLTKIKATNFPEPPTIDGHATSTTSRTRKTVAKKRDGN